MAAPRKPGLNPDVLGRILGEASAELGRRYVGSTRVMIVSVDGPVEIQASSFFELQRASRYDNELRALLSGSLPPNSFDRRWAGRSIGGYDLPNADEALYLASIGEAAFEDFYPDRGGRR